jgi:phosphoserine phosphatase
LILVVQSPEATPEQAAELARLSGATASTPIGAHAFRLQGAVRRPEGAAHLAEWCQARRLDHAWVPEERRFSSLKLLAMDMDSTLITIECIDELGGQAGKKAEIAAITERAMRGEIDYAGSMRPRVGLLAGLDERALQDVYEEKLRLSPGAEVLVDACKRHGVTVLLVSGGFAFYTERLKARLGLDETLSNVLEIDAGRLTGKVLGPLVDARAKAARFRQLAQRLGAQREQTVAIGDGANDVPMMAEAGVSVGYHPKPVVRAKVTHVLDYSGLDGVLNLFT